MTRPPDLNSSAMPLTPFMPIRWSRAAPDEIRRAPERLVANTAPIVCWPASEPVVGPRSIGSNASIWLLAASSASTCDSGVPARALMTSSVGS